MTWSIVAITTATILSVAVPASAQVLRPLTPAVGAWAAGKVRDGDGWRNPTTDEALRLLGMERGVGEAWTLLLGGQNIFRPAVAILRQELGGSPGGGARRVRSQDRRHEPGRHDALGARPG